MNDAALWALIAEMSLEEKALLLSGDDAWTTKANLGRGIPGPSRASLSHLAAPSEQGLPVAQQAAPARFAGIPALRMADGPHGLRRVVQNRAQRKAQGGDSLRATCFPPACTLACSFDPDLAAEIGGALAEEARAQGVDMVLGPGVNIKRSPLGGRNFEYFSEDPVLAGEMAAGYISGMQAKGVAASLKHYAVNNQERSRMTVSAAVDERALFDLYLKPFEIAVKAAQPATVMASYNRVNGTYACENKRLLREILRTQFGFEGAVISDWGAVNNRAAGVAAGLDLEMPGSGSVNDANIIEAVRRGYLSETDVDAACLNVLRLVTRWHAEGEYSADYEAHHRLAVRALEKSAVLLQNDGMLPLRDEGSLAVIGQMAQIPRYQGAGSSVVNPQHLESFLKAMREAGRSFIYQPGYDGAETSETMLNNAVRAAQNVERVILFLGLPDVLESEGYDRPHMRLPQAHLKLVYAVTNANPNVCVVLCGGSPVELPFLDSVRAVLCAYLGGEGVGEGIMHLLYGQANPCGKLAETWPLLAEDVPCAHTFPAGPKEAAYTESLYVGYRYYDSAGKAVRFPFGYGLSYTQYEYSELHVSETHLVEGEGLTLRFRLENTGGISGEEAFQVYISRKGSATFQPEKELKAFARVPLAAGEARVITVELPYEAFGYYNEARGCHCVEQGEVEVRVGASSRDIRLAAEIHLQGVDVHPKPAARADGPYGSITGNEFPIENFAALYAKPLTGNEPDEKGTYTLQTPLGVVCKTSVLGRFIMRAAGFVAARTLHFSAVPEVNRRVVEAAIGELPLKNLPLNSGGIVSYEALSALLGYFNGRGGFFRFLRLTLKRKPYKKLKKHLPAQPEEETKA